MSDHDFDDWMREAPHPRIDTMPAGYKRMHRAVWGRVHEMRDARFDRRVHGARVALALSTRWGSR